MLSALITGKIITVDQIIKVADYLEETKANYVRLIKADKEKNNDVYIDNGDYHYYSTYNPKLEYEIRYTDGRETTTQDVSAQACSTTQPSTWARKCLGRKRRKRRKAE